jgi:hypothetical protein
MNMLSKNLTKCKQLKSVEIVMCGHDYLDGGKLLIMTSDVLTHYYIHILMYCKITACCNMIVHSITTHCNM